MEWIVNIKIICYDYFGDIMKLNVKQFDIPIIECKSFKTRLIGFMFRIKKINHGLLFKNCDSIHTFFMFQPIDVIMTDRNDNILYMYKSLKPNRIIVPKKNVYNTYELPINCIKNIEGI